MNIFVIDRRAVGVIDVRNFERFILKNITTPSQYQQEMISAGKNIMNYKYCEVDEITEIPPFIKIIDGLSNFRFERVKIGELNLTDDQIKDIVQGNIKEKLSTSYNKLIPAIVDIIEELGAGEKHKEVIIQIRALESEIKNFDKNKYLEQLL